MRTQAPHRPHVLAAPDKATVPRKLDGPEVRISADHPGAGMEEVRGPTRTIVKVPETVVKLFPSDAVVSVPGPTKGSRLTRVKAAWLPRHEIMKKVNISFFISRNAGVQKSTHTAKAGI